MHISFFREILPLWLLRKIGLDKTYAEKVLGWEIDKDPWSAFFGFPSYHFHVGRNCIVYPSDYRSLKVSLRYLRLA
jgi:hypothetical protein